MHSILLHLALAGSISALPLQPSTVTPLERRIDIPLPLGPLGSVAISALKPDGTVNVCAKVSKEALGAISAGLSSIDLGVDIAQTLGPLTPYLSEVVDLVPADVTVGALNADGTATVCASVPQKEVSSEHKRAISVDLGGAGVDIKRKREAAVSVDLGGVGVDIKRK